MVDNAPSPVKEGVSKEEAEKIKAELEEAGATVELSNRLDPANPPSFGRRVSFVKQSDLKFEMRRTDPLLQKRRSVIHG